MQYDLRGIVDDALAIGVSHEAELLQYCDALVVGFQPALNATLPIVIHSLGERALVDSAAVIAGFSGIVRIADATGIPLEQTKAEQTSGLRAHLGIDRYQNSKS